MSINAARREVQSRIEKIVSRKHTGKDTEAGTRSVLQVTADKELYILEKVHRIPPRWEASLLRGLQRNIWEPPFCQRKQIIDRGNQCWPAEE
jgi:hypothetical protein